ncbi:EscU/YscU/HrcU family type III secretion system export apparatus switch protein [Bacillus sp. V2I10]|uniref:EscU/YscU/HrcU family type III secretion system export apparatus switch protein n=1 Tax=Bacillus sp. V2I10 TaxID=3042276 RepID=UPI00278AC89A|nr:hypothetical protein [Bacillus sp. V2I10]MDQ0860142.1 hypothetical protein [Bacillus sp. V2I10]
MNKIIAGKRQMLIQKEEMPAFRKNSIIYGKILEKSGDLAVIQIGDTKLKAMIDSSLPSSGTYWYEVKSSKEGNSVLLKMLTKANGRDEPSDAPQFILKLLKEANIARTKEHVDFLQRVLREHPGITRKDLQQVLQHAADSGSDHPAKLMSSLSFALKNNLPLSDAVINSLCEVQSRVTLYDQLKQLNSVIETEKLPLNALKAQIGSMVAQDFANNANNLAGVLSFFQKQLGLKGEISLLQQLAKGADLIHQEDSLKLLLLTASQNQTNQAVKEKIDQLISKLNGQALLGADQGITQHCFMQIPLHYGQFQSDLNIEWTGRKNERGEIDPDYCRVLFYLNMNVLKDIMIDLHIQNRIMTVTIYNQFKDPSLIEILHKMEVNEQIPEELYQAVAEIFSFIYHVDKEAETMSEKSKGQD